MLVDAVDLVARSGRGDQSAFAELYDDFVGATWAACVATHGVSPGTLALFRTRWLAVWECAPQLASMRLVTHEMVRRELTVRFASR